MKIKIVKPGSFSAKHFSYSALIAALAASNVEAVP